MAFRRRRSRGRPRRRGFKKRRRLVRPKGRGVKPLRLGRRM